MLTTLSQLIIAGQPLMMDGRRVISDPRAHTRKWASRHPFYTGLAIGVLFYLVEILATGDALGSLPFAVAIAGIFALTAFGERRRRKNNTLPF